MARYYRRASGRLFTGQYLLVWQRSRVCSLSLGLKLRVIFIRVDGTSSNVQGVFWSLFYQAEKLLLSLFKNLAK